MIPIRAVLTVSLLLLCGTAVAKEAPKHRVLIELFTSQG